MKRRIAFALLMGALTTGVISLSLVYLNLGLRTSFWDVWLRSWAMAYLIVVPLILVVAPRLQAVVTRLIGAPGRQRVAGSDRMATRHRIVFALLMGVLTTGVISFAILLRNLGLREDFLQRWATSWGIGYIVVIPAILLVGPLLQRWLDRVFE